MSKPMRYLTRIREDGAATSFEVVEFDEGRTVAMFTSVTELSVEVLRSLLRTMTAKPARRVRYPALRAVRSGGA